MVFNHGVPMGCTANGIKLSWANVSIGLLSSLKDSKIK
ncbi:MAG: hypothetical protein K0R59_143 [Sphingobacterium sp.]|jgi:hypothetical protein|nr:hypothetical protein [Sphingobacterium sp.]